MTGVLSRLDNMSGLLRPMSMQSTFSEPGQPAAEVSSHQHQMQVRGDRCNGWKQLHGLTARKAAPFGGSWLLSGHFADDGIKTGRMCILGHRFQNVILEKLLIFSKLPTLRSQTCKSMINNTYGQNFSENLR